MKNRNIICEADVTGMEFPNNGTGQLDGTKIILKGALPGQRVLAKFTKKKGVLHGRVLETLSRAPEETEPTCRDFGKCGGCTYQNLPYPTEISLKEKLTLRLFDDAGIKNADDFIYDGIVAAPSESTYRNKMEYSFGDLEKDGQMSLGIRKKESYYEVVTPEQCEIIDGDNKKILLTVLEYFKESVEKFYRKTTHTGTLRHLIIRKGFFTGEILVNLVTTSGLSTALEPLAEKINALETDGTLVGILHTVNDSPSDAVICDRMEILYGRDFFYERLLGLKFKISPFSFFQTNSAGAERLYETVREFARLGRDGSGAGVVFDLYCGAGTIGQIISSEARKVIGVELIAEAVDAAKENAVLNGIENCRFISGDVLTVVDELEDAPDLIVLDPPRQGIHPKAIGKIIAFGADRLIYVSCNPVTLVRDLGVFLEKGYRCERVRIHDMFPRTPHVECVVLMSQRG